MGNSVGKAFGIVILFVFIAVLSEVVIDATASSNATGATLLLLNLLPFVVVAIGILLGLKEAGLLGGK